MFVCPSPTIATIRASSTIIWWRASEGILSCRHLIAVSNCAHVISWQVTTIRLLSSRGLSG
jgi:hypothetical protein